MVSGFLIFPGQGSQRVGMGRDLAEEFTEAREVFAEVDEALGVALSKIMFEGPLEELTRTHNAQPAIVAHSLAVFQILRDHLGTVGTAGHSVGEYAAYSAAGALTVSDAVRLVRRRGEAMLEVGQRRPGTMAAIIGLSSDEVIRICSEHSDESGCVVAANLNSPEQSVLSGDISAVKAAGIACKAAGAKRVLSLPVSGAFHSPLMEEAVAPFAAALDQTTFVDPKVPVVSSARVEFVTSATGARDILQGQLAEPVRWVDCVRFAAEKFPDVVFHELGPGKVLSGLNRRILGEASINVGTVTDIQAFMAVS